MSLLLKNMDTKPWRGGDLNLGSGKNHNLDHYFICDMLWRLRAKGNDFSWRKDRFRKISLDRQHLSGGKKEHIVWYCRQAWQGR